jgi:hypothetical protein
MIDSYAFDDPTTIYKISIEYYKDTISMFRHGNDIRFNGNMKNFKDKLRKECDLYFLPINLSDIIECFDKIQISCRDITDIDDDFKILCNHNSIIVYRYRVDLNNLIDFIKSMKHISDIGEMIKEIVFNFDKLKGDVYITDRELKNIIQKCQNIK